MSQIRRRRLMAYVWDKDLETGHELIDNQHKQLVRAVNDLQVANASGKAAEEIERTIDFLLGYTVKHFHDEEALQIEYGYPDYYEHVSYHREFKGQVAQLAGRLQEEGPTRELVDEISQHIGDWLLHHIKSDDLKMATYVQQEDARRRGPTI
jgi:hemerythrin